MLGEEMEEEVEERGRLASLDLLGEPCNGDTNARSVSTLLDVLRSLLLRSSVARSGLLAVPGERYMERRFVWRSVSSWAS